MDRIPKYALPVRVHLIGEPSAVLGVVYVRQDQRIIDMLCEARPFFAVTKKEGLLLINKAAVSNVSVLARETVEQDPELFPGASLAALDQRAA